MIIVHNDGKEIISTNYYESSYANAGLYYVSINAGAYRLLVPPQKISEIPEMETAREVVISRGPWTIMARPDAIELLFDDHTQDPYSLQLLPEVFDRLPSAADQGWKGVCIVYVMRAGRLTRLFDRPVFYRQVREIPCLKEAPSRA